MINIKKKILKKKKQRFYFINSALLTIEVVVVVITMNPFVCFLTYQGLANKIKKVGREKNNEKNQDVVCC